MSKKTNHEPHPYIDARNEWTERYGSIVTHAKNWRIAFFVVLIYAGLVTLGLVAVSSQQKVVPYIIAIDDIGRMATVGRADTMAKPTDTLIKATLAQFIKNVRSVSYDETVQNKATAMVYFHLANTTQAFTFLSTHFSSDPPTVRSTSETVTVDVSSILRVNESTWQVEWSEKVFSSKGEQKAHLVMKANLTVAFNPPQDEKEIYINPLGLFITNIAWSKIN